MIWVHLPSLYFFKDMEFMIQEWSLHVVLIGSVAVLEAVRGPERISTDLNPLDSPREIACQLIDQPSCSLRCH